MVLRADTSTDSLKAHLYDLEKRFNNQLVRQSQIVQSVMYSHDAVISSYITPAIHSWDFDDETI